MSYQGRDFGVCVQQRQQAGTPFVVQAASLEQEALVFALVRGVGLFVTCGRRLAALGLEAGGRRCAHARVCLRARAAPSPPPMTV